MSPHPRESLIAAAHAARARTPSVLERTNSGMFWIDAYGQAISPASARFQLAVRYLYYSAGGLFVVGIGAMAGGIVGGVVGGALATAVIASLDRPWAFLARLSPLVLAGRLDEAEALCRRLLSRRRASTQMRSLGHRSLATMRLMAGDHAGALEQLRSAAALRESSPEDASLVERASLICAEVWVLVNLGRVAEARTRLTTLRAPRRDYLRIRYWVADLIVQLGEGHLSISEDEVWERARVGLSILSSGALVPLCAWAFAQLGDTEMSAHLRDVALDRNLRGLDRALPALHQWLQSAKQPAAD